MASVIKASSSSSTTTPRWEHDVFLSFRGEDTRRSFTDHLYSALRQKDIYTFRDDVKLKSGELISPKLLKAIKESRFAVAILSEDYASSGWCLEELAEIVQCMKSQGLIVFVVFYHLEQSHVTDPDGKFWNSISKHERRFKEKCWDALIKLADEAGWDVKQSSLRNKKGEFGEAFKKLELCFEDGIGFDNYMDVLTNIADITGWDLKDSDVRRMSTEYFCKGLHKLKEDFLGNVEKVNGWRKALTEATNVPTMWEVKDRCDEAEIIQQITNEILKALDEESLIVTGDLVGIDSRIKKLESYLDMRLADVRTIGISGIGGVGKTTIAQELTRRIHNQFDAFCFLAYVREESKRKGLAHLQRELYKNLLGIYASTTNVEVGQSTVLRERLRSKKVLIVLDDVDDLRQIEALVGKGDERHNMFGSGSRIIVTSRDTHLFKAYGVNDFYEVDKLNEIEALQLLCRKAFKKKHPNDDYEELANEVVQWVDGLPLALEVLGCTLYRKDKVEWLAVLERLKENPNKEILATLEISFERLEETEKKIFLDIACFFRGEIRYRVERILESCNFYPKIGISVLTDKSLVKIERNRLWMHDMLQQMGWSIVRQESLEEPGKRSRLWFHRYDYHHEHKNSWTYKDARKVLLQNEGTNAVEGMLLDLPTEEEMHLKDDPLSKMRYLRLLKICNVKISKYLKYLSNELRLLEWEGYPLKSLPLSFLPERLVELSLPNSCIEQLWKELRLSSMKLVLINLSNCKNLTETPDLSMVANLERLILEGCENLFQVHPSIGKLKHLVILNLKGCKNLEKLPEIIDLRNLEILILSGCSKLDQLPEIPESMERLSELHLDGTAIKKLPMSIQHLHGLILLNLSGCLNLMCFPDIICSSLTSIKVLNLSGCSLVDQIPKNIGNLEYLQDFDVSGTAIKTIPCSIRQLKNLESLSFRGCKLEEGAIAGDDIGCLSSLKKLDLSENNFVTIPESICQLLQLRELLLNNCNNLRSLPRHLPKSLKYLYAHDCAKLKRFPKDHVNIFGDNKGFIHCDTRDILGKDYRETMYSRAVGEGSDQFVPRFIEDQIYQGKCFDIRFACIGVPDWWTHSKIGSSITRRLSPEDKNSLWTGIVVFFLFEIHNNDIFDESWESKETYCQFRTDKCQMEFRTDFMNFSGFVAGSYGVCRYVPRKDFTEQLNEASHISASISSERPDLKVISCGMHLISELNAAEFTQNLTRTCFEGVIIMKETLSHAQSDIGLSRTEEVENNSLTESLHESIQDHTSNPESINPTIGSQNDLNSLLSKLFWGPNARRHSFCFFFDEIKLVSAWFSRHSIGNAVFDYLPQKIFYDDSWVGLELYCSFRRRPSTSDNNSKSFFSVDVYAHGSSTSWHIEKFSFKITCLSELVVFHVPRVCFPEYLNNCQGIGALFKATTQDVDIEICGIRLVYENDLEKLIKTLGECSLGRQDVLDHLYIQANGYLQMVAQRIPLEDENDQSDAHEVITDYLQPWERKLIASFEELVTEQKASSVGCSAVDGQIQINCTSSTEWELIESLGNLLASLEPSVKQISTSFQNDNQEHCHQQKQCLKESDPIILHMKQNLLDQWDWIQENIAKECTNSIHNHLQIMVETLPYGSAVDFWKRVHKSMVPLVKMVTLSCKGHTIYSLQHFDPRSTFNFCFPQKSILEWLESYSSASWMIKELPSDLAQDRDFRGVVICADISIVQNKQSAILDNINFKESFKLLCHLRSNGFCWNPVPTYSITKERFKWLQRCGFIWLTYIPCWLISQTNLIGYLEAEIYNDFPELLTVEKCGIRLLYQKDMEDFKQALSQCWSLFFEDLDLIRQFAEEADEHEKPHHAQKGKTDGIFIKKDDTIHKIVLLGEHMESFNIGDEIYNSCFPAALEDLQWFYNKGDGHSITIQLPPNCNWIGLALFAYFSDIDNPSCAQDKLDPESAQHLICSFETEKGNVEHLHSYQASYKGLGDGRFIWLSCIPKVWFMDLLDQCSLLEATFVSETPGIKVEKCGMRFVYKQDEEEFKQYCVCLASLLLDEKVSMVQEE